MRGGILDQQCSLVEQIGEHLGRHAVGPVGFGVDGDEVAHTGIVVHHSHGDGVDGRRLGERAVQDHLGHRVAEGLHARRLARPTQVVVLSGVPHLDGEPAGQAAEERLGAGHELGAIERVVSAVRAVGHDRDPGPTGAQDRTALLLERSPAPPASDGPVERDEVAVPERGLGGGLSHAPSCRPRMVKVVSSSGGRCRHAAGSPGYVKMISPPAAFS